MIRINTLREKRKPLEAADHRHNKKFKTKPVMYPNDQEKLHAMDDQEENKDPDSKEAKRKRRLIRNRMSAQLNRERKKSYIGELEDQLQNKKSEVKALLGQLAVKTAESERLKRQLATCTCRTILL
ncbi:bZIP transcription factor 49 [Phytophthora citrophthora]|uniref:BZIP transcription factor 49 n=1 Tax=Phytophthora citrophthora TaxID=4793 RepID=A0AAD9LLL6_9STRA|nr:bZIP transcription factor 49 [Phytophthora citrophthora]